MQVNSVQSNRQQSFGMTSPLVPVMDFVNKNFVTGFITQDGLGFIVPRVVEGANRGRARDPETGKKTGPYNMQLARKEALREVLTGPSSFLIPLGLVGIAKKLGRANNVKTDYIKGFEQTLSEFAQKDGFKKGGKLELRTRLYGRILKDTFGDSIESKQIAEKANEYAALHESVPSMKKLTEQITQDFTALRKSTADALENFGSAQFKSGDKTITGAIEEIVGAVHDYAGDAVKTLSKKAKDGNVAENMIKTFTKNRAFTRTLTNVAAIAGVAAFWQIIPKLYNKGLKGNPALAGTAAAGANDAAPQPAPTTESAKQPSFTAAAGHDVSFTGLGSAAARAIELSGAVIPPVGMAALLYGVCIPPRLIHAQDKYDRSEIIFRDLTSFTALLFGAKALTRALSDKLAKATGFALNIKPDDHGKSFFTKFRDYVSLGGKSTRVLSSGDIATRYGSVDGYKEGLGGLEKFVNKNGGNFEKLKTKYFKGNADEMLKALKDPNNILVKKAKNINSGIAALATLALTPAFIITVAKICETMTKKQCEKDMSKQPAFAAASAAQPEVSSVAASVQKKDIPREVVFNHGKNMAQWLNG